MGIVERSNNPKEKGSADRDYNINVYCESSKSYTFCGRLSHLDVTRNGVMNGHGLLVSNLDRLGNFLTRLPEIANTATVEELLQSNHCGGIYEILDYRVGNKLNSSNRKTVSPIISITNNTNHTINTLMNGVICTIPPGPARAADRWCSENRSGVEIVFIVNDKDTPMQVVLYLPFDIDMNNNIVHLKEIGLMLTHLDSYVLEDMENSQITYTVDPYPVEGYPHLQIGPAKGLEIGDEVLVSLNGLPFTFTVSETIEWDRAKLSMVVDGVKESVNFNTKDAFTDDLSESFLCRTQICKKNISVVIDKVMNRARFNYTTNMYVEHCRSTSMFESFSKTAEALHEKDVEIDALKAEKEELQKKCDIFEFRMKQEEERTTREKEKTAREKEKTQQNKRSAKVDKWKSVVDGLKIATGIIVGIGVIAKGIHSLFSAKESTA